MIAPPLRLGVNPRASFQVFILPRESYRLRGKRGSVRITAQFESDMKEHVAAGLIDAAGFEADHSAGAVARAATLIPSSASILSALCIEAATRAPTIGAITYSQALVKLAVAIIGPNEMAGLKLAPVKLPAIMMLRATVIPIAIGARLPALRATAVVSTTMTRKKASTASITNPASGVIVSVVAPRTTPRASSGRPRPVATPPSTARKRNAAQAPATSWLIM